MTRTRESPLVRALLFGGLLSVAPIVQAPAAGPSRKLNLLFVALYDPTADPDERVNVIARIALPLQGRRRACRN